VVAQKRIRLFRHAKKPADSEDPTLTPEGGERPKWFAQIWPTRYSMIDADFAGTASGRIEGQIQALFCRYQAVGGFEYTSDFRIGPRKGSKTVGIMPGDSRTLWFEDNTLSLEDAKTVGIAGDFVKKYRPFAPQWAGRRCYRPASPKPLPNSRSPSASQ
jgi:hypothetical protein